MNSNYFYEINYEITYFYVAFQYETSQPFYYQTLFRKSHIYFACIASINFSIHSFTNHGGYPPLST